MSDEITDEERTLFWDHMDGFHEHRTVEACPGCQAEAEEEP